jgi:hypothetical protein
MAITYEPIVSTTLTSATASVVFGSIPSTYTDLVLITSTQHTNADTSSRLYLRFNGDSATNYSYTQLRGSGSAAFSTRESNINTPWIGFVAPNTTATDFSIAKTNIANYSNSTTYKTFISRGDGVSNGNYPVIANVCMWRSTAAINSIIVASENYNFSSGSTFTLYGILKA